MYRGGARVERDRAASEGLERRRGRCGCGAPQSHTRVPHRRLGLGSRASILSCEDELPGQRPLREGRRHAGSPLLARRRAPVGLAPGLSRRWLRIPRASWPSRSSRPRTPGGIVASASAAVCAAFLGARAGLSGRTSSIRSGRRDGHELARKARAPGANRRLVLRADSYPPQNKIGGDVTRSQWGVQCARGGGVSALGYRPSPRCAHPCSPTCCRRCGLLRRGPTPLRNVAAHRQAERQRPRTDPPRAPSFQCGA